MQEFTFGSAFLPSYTFISSTHTHTHLFSFLQSMVRFSCLNKTTVEIYWCICGCVNVTFRVKIPSILSIYDKFCKRTCHESISSTGKEQKAAWETVMWDLVVPVPIPVLFHSGRLISLVCDIWYTLKDACIFRISVDAAYISIYYIG